MIWEWNIVARYWIYMKITFKIGWNPIFKVVTKPAKHPWLRHRSFAAQEMWELLGSQQLGNRKSRFGWEIFGFTKNHPPLTPGYRGDRSSNYWGTSGPPVIRTHSLKPSEAGLKTVLFNVGKGLRPLPTLNVLISLRAGSIRSGPNEMSTLIQSSSEAGWLN